LNNTKNRALVTCTLSNINILRSLPSACYYFYYWREISLFRFLLLTCSYSSHPFLCDLALQLNVLRVTLWLAWYWMHGSRASVVNTIHHKDATQQEDDYKP